MMLKVLSSFFAVPLIVKVLTLGLEEGDFCKLTNGDSGICLNILKCKYGRDLLLQGDQPITCGFEGRIPIVCCVAALRETPNVTVIVKNNFTILTEKYLSEEKCSMYYPKVYYILINGDKGGKPALKDEFAYMAAVGYGKKEEVQWLCGGSLISENFVLTAAHCVFSSEFGNASWIRLGEIDISKDNSSHIVDVAIKTVYMHPGYKHPERYHDIGLLELAKKIQFSRNIKPACLDTYGTFEKWNLTALGWGRTSFTDDPSNTLLKVDLKAVPLEKCKTYFPNINDTLQLCAGGGPDTDTCQGDSGGPLHIRDRHERSGGVAYRVVAITSYGNACGLTRSPGVYTRTFVHLEWIENIVWPSG